MMDKILDVLYGLLMLVVLLVLIILNIIAYKTYLILGIYVTISIIPIMMLVALFTVAKELADRDEMSE